MQKNVNRWRWGAMLVLAIALLCTGFAAMAAQPKIIDTVPGAVRDKQAAAQVGIAEMAAPDAQAHQGPQEA